MSQVSLHPMLNIAVKAARAGGAVISRASLDLERLQVSAKGHNDFVTEVDRASEAAIIETLLAAYPGHGILAEESGRSHGAKDSEYVWIIDPLDGTTNFIHGLPIYAVSIALAYRGQVQQGVVYDPARNDLFYATRGRGAFLNDRRLRVSRRSRIGEALIGTGFPFRRGDNLHRYVEMMEQVMSQCAGLRRPGAAALDLCYVAAGWYDAFFETGLSPWDVAAGSLIVTEAGGLVGNFTGEADFLFQREVIAGTPKVYAQVVKILAPYTKAISMTPADAAGAPASADAGGTPDEAADPVLEAMKAAASGALPAGGEPHDAAPPRPARAPLRAPARRAGSDGPGAAPTSGHRAAPKAGAARAPRRERPAEEPAAAPAGKVHTLKRKAG